jgi:transcriptional regulator with XRE-family HTH domain
MWSTHFFTLQVKIYNAMLNAHYKRSETMLLKDYLEDNSISQSEFARQIKIHQPNISRYLNCKQFPDVATLSIIRAATNGEVTANDFVDQWEKKA